MIKKINRQVIRYKDCFIRSKILADKINELVVIVNVLQSRLDSYAGPETPTDPYAKQRKWIGKLCWFWDCPGAPKCMGILAKVDDEKPDYPFGANCTKDANRLTFFRHCEPMVAGDELIYKGE